VKYRDISPHFQNSSHNRREAPQSKTTFGEVVSTTCSRMMVKLEGGVSEVKLCDTTILTDTTFGDSRGWSRHDLSRLKKRSWSGYDKSKIKKGLNLPASVATAFRKEGSSHVTIFSLQGAGDEELVGAFAPSFSFKNETCHVTIDKLARQRDKY
jgi:hypothetical protein